MYSDPVRPLSAHESKIHALGGGELIGERIVRLVYMDEAGIGNPAEEPHVVVSAVIVNADEQLLILERYLDALITEYIPAEHQKDFVFHATHLFNGGGPVFKRDKWPIESRLKIADELSAIFGRFGVYMTFGWVERADFPKTFDLPEDMKSGQKTVAANVVAFVQCAMAVEKWMQENTSNEVCMLIAEDNKQSRQIIKDTQRYHQNAANYDVMTDEERKYFPFTKIKQDPLFEPKKRLSILQLADYCAYVFKRFLMEDKRYNRFLDPFRGQFAVLKEYERFQNRQKAR